RLTVSKDLLFEIGTEEIPPHLLPQVARNFHERLLKGLDSKDLPYRDSTLFYTHRRLASIISDLVEAQPDKLEKVRGPAKHVGIAEDGGYTEAARGFAQSHDSSVEDLYTEEIAEGHYLFLDKKIRGRQTAEVLKDLLPRIILDLPLPEQMWWSDPEIQFIRPIRWLACIYGENPLAFELGSLSAGTATRGHRFLDNCSVEISFPGQYEEILKDHFVLPRPDDRLSRLQDQLEKSTKEVGGQEAASEGFLRTLADSLEYSSPIQGELPSEFLQLPRLLLFKTLEDEARLVPLVDENDDPLPNFVGFRDGGEDETGKVQEGYESVVSARLRDSRFFYNQDRQQPLSDYVDDLKTVTFHEQLGSIWDKVERMRNIAKHIADKNSIGTFDLIDRTVFLCKADLVTAVVDEFPDLQGQIGSIYAELDGEPPEVVKGIRNHYKPENAGQPPPQTNTAMAASLADKLDTLIGSFLLGQQPTGTRDPYGLRRKANGVVRTVLVNDLNFDLFRLNQDLLPLYDFLGNQSVESLEQLEEYFKNRLEHVLEEDYQIRYDVIDSVIATGPGNFVDIHSRAQALTQAREHDRLEELVNAFTRVASITEGIKNTDFDPSQFRKDSEKELWRSYLKLDGKISDLLDQRDYRQMLAEFWTLLDPINEYFENVMVMADDPEVRRNRIAFLNSMKETFLHLGDLSQIVLEE
ncbi:MAG: glycine--tRNA ligase subunit beta, partial [Candidatus Acetothermia bacterium]